MEAKDSATTDKPPVKKRRLDTLLEAAVIVSSETLRMTAAANKKNPANILLSSSPEAEPSLSRSVAKREAHSSSPSLSESSLECTKPFSLPLPGRSTPCRTPPMIHSSPEVPPAPYRETITCSKLPPDYPFGRKLEWTPGGHPVEPPLTFLPPSPNRGANVEDVGNDRRPKTLRRAGLSVFDHPDAWANLSPVHIPPFQDAFLSRRVSSNYSEESLKRKNVSPRKSAPKEP